MNDMTEGALTVVTDGKIDLTGIRDLLGLHDGKRVLIVGSKSSTIRLFPVGDEEIWFTRVVMDINRFNSIMRDVHSKMRELNLDIIFTTGVCMVKEDCFLEAYFSVKDKEQIRKFVDWLEGNNAVIRVETEHLDVK